MTEKNLSTTKSTNVAMTSLKTEGLGSSYLSEDETKQILTPFAFEIDKTLFGVPLSVPWKRGVALLIDLLLIAMLAETPGEVLALVVAITFFRLGSKRRAKMLGKKRGIAKMLLRLLGAFIIFVVLLDIIDEVTSSSGQLEYNPWQGSGTESKLTNTIALGAITGKAFIGISQSDCQNYNCWFEHASPLIEQLAELNLPIEQAGGVIGEVVDEMSLPKQERVNLERTLIKQYQALVNEHQRVNVTKIKTIKPSIDNVSVISGAYEEKSDSTDKNTGEANQPLAYKGLEWFTGIIEDLGLSFGWAAFYFSVLTSMWHGQTPGKKLLKIRVIQLDGTPLSMWDSFGRYGGYGAGLATGLLGFLQIYWDPNRQAIHDKISATIVIDDKKFEQMKNT